MSGVALGNSHELIDKAAATLEHASSNPLHLALALHLRRVSTAYNAVDMVLSGDWAHGDEKQAVLEVVAQIDLNKAAIHQANIAISMLSEAVELLTPGTGAGHVA